MYKRQRHPYTRALLDAIPRIEAPLGDRLAAISGAPPDLSSPPPGCRFHPRCSRALERCSLEQPPLAKDEAEGSTFACFNPLGGDDAPAATDSAAPTIALAAERAEDVTPQQDVLLAVFDLVKTYELGGALFSRRGREVVHAVSCISFELGRGETLGLVGESGCGKSTTGRLVVGAERPHSGSVVFEGVDIARVRGRQQWRRDLQMVFQDPYSSLDPRMPVVDIIGEPLAIHSVGDGALRRRRISELLDIVGLPADATGRYAFEFSGGQRQRIALARSLALNPKLIVADEPVSALDVSIRAQIVNLMTDLQQEFGISYLMISHDVAVVRHFAERVAVMYLGKLVEVGPTAEVIARPIHPYTEMLVRTIPVPDPAIERAKPRLAGSDDVPSAARPPSGCRFHTRCPRMQPLCVEIEPPMAAYGGARTAACHFPLLPAAAPESKLNAAL
jgi:peptide/nickel transport system ATP-binding protein